MLSYFLQFMYLCIVSFFGRKTPSLQGSRIRRCLYTANTGQGQPSVAHTGGATPPSLHHATGGDARPSLLFAPPGNGFSTRDARWQRLRGQDTSSLMRDSACNRAGPLPAVRHLSPATIGDK